MMPTLEEVRNALQDRNLRRVAEATGLDYGTLCKFANGRARGVPTYETVKTLIEYLGLVTVAAKQQ